jgi:hypothetical protein
MYVITFNLNYIIFVFTFWLLVQHMSVIYFLSYYCCCFFHCTSCPCLMGRQLIYCLHCPSTEISTIDMSMLVRLHDSIVT